MKIFLLMVFVYGASSGTVLIPMQDLQSCIKARDAVVLDYSFAAARPSRKICITDAGDVLEKAP